MGKVKDFINKYLDDAKLAEKANGVPYLLTLAQAALESGWGKHAPGNNFFGVKDSSGWNDGVQVKKTKEVVDGKEIEVEARFEKYATPFDSFFHHGKIMQKNWHQAFVHRDPVDFITVVQASEKKYATDPDYVEKIHKVILTIKRNMEK